MTLTDILNDTKKFRIFFSKMVPFSQLIKIPDKLVLCPFHQDNEPSAKFYMDDDGIERIFCYSCRKQFMSYDYVTQVMGTKPQHELLGFYNEAELETYAAAMQFTVPVIVDKVDVESLARECLPDVSALLNRIYTSCTVTLDGTNG